MHNYLSPVDKLLTLGDPRDEDGWRDYLALGIRAEHVPDLIRMALDRELNSADSESKEVWAPLHAWRTLGQLRAPAAIEPLLELLHLVDEYDDDWTPEELPEVYGMLGPAAIPALVAFLADKSHGLWALIAAGNALQKIGEHHPQARDACVAAITQQLERFAENDPTLNSMLISSLLDLHAIESAGVIERAFAAKRVDLTGVGDWEDVQIAFGMKADRTTPRERTKLDDVADLLDGWLQKTRKQHSRELVDDVISQMRMRGELKSPKAQQAAPIKKKKKKKKKK